MDIISLGSSQPESIVPLAAGFGLVIVGTGIAVWLKRIKSKMRQTILREPEK